MLLSYLDEFMQRERNGQMHSQAMENIVVDIAAMYPVHTSLIVVEAGPCMSLRSVDDVVVLCCVQLSF